MSDLRLPELEIRIGRATRLVETGVRVTLALVGLLVVGMLVAALVFGPEPTIRAVGGLLGSGS